jgi:hypothetical protein
LVQSKGKYRPLSAAEVIFAANRQQATIGVGTAALEGFAALSSNFSHVCSRNGFQMPAA